MVATRPVLGLKGAVTTGPDWLGLDEGDGVGLVGTCCVADGPTGPTRAVDPGAWSTEAVIVVSHIWFGMTIEMSRRIPDHATAPLRAAETRACFWASSC